MQTSVPMGRIAVFLGDHGGSVTAWMLLWSALFLALGGLAVDAVNAYRTQAILQSTADMAAHAALVEIVKANELASGSDVADIRAEAVLVARANMPPGAYGEVAMASDIEIGTWDGSAFTNTGELAGANAARVVVRRTAARGNPLPLSFLRILGRGSWDIAAQAIAAHSAGACQGSRGQQIGIFSAGHLRIDSRNRAGEGFCLYGFDGVGYGQNNVGGLASPDATVPGGSTILASPDRGNIEADDGRPEPGFAQAADTIGIERPDPYIDAIGIAGANPLPPTRQALVALADPAMIDTANPVYKVTCAGGSLSYDQIDEVIRDITLVYDCPRVSFASGMKFTNVTLVNIHDPAGGSSNITFSANAELRSNRCAGGSERMDLYTHGSVTLNGKAKVEGLFAVIGGDLGDANAQLEARDLIAIYTGGNATFTSRSEFFGCSTGAGAPLASGARRFRIVR